MRAAVRELGVPLLAAGALAATAAPAPGGGAGPAATSTPAPTATPAPALAEPAAGSYEVGGIAVDVAGRSAEQARLGGWRLAQRRGWARLAARLGVPAGAPGDATLDGLVAGIVVEHEQLGPQRYIATLGVLFDRARAGELLGIAAAAARSAPQLVVPVMWSGGAGQAYEGQAAGGRSEWQAAWARFRAGSSAIDYVRPGGTGPDALLLTVGQLGRPGRGWWRRIMARYGAAGVLAPVVRLNRLWPGGPVVGSFQARYGADDRLLGGFTLRVDGEDALPRLLDAGVARLDELYGRALRLGYLAPDPTLAPLPPPRPAADAAPPPGLDAVIDALRPAGAAEGGRGAAVTIQFDTPGPAAVAATEAAVRAVPGVRSAQTTSLALGGQSLMRVQFDGEPELLRAALQARGFQVGGGGAVLRLRRAGAPGGSGG